MLQIHTFESITGNEQLADGMFQDRALQFVDRLKWDIEKDSYGREIDQYDNSNAYYLVWVDKHGGHLGSLRVAPTSSQYMVRDFFQEDFAEMTPKSSKDWEVTRFCISPSAPRELIREISAELLRGLCLFAVERGIQRYLGLCFPAMLRIYHRLGWVPATIERSTLDSNLILATWVVSFQTFLSLFSRAKGQPVSALIEPSTVPNLAKQ